jgi:glycosyltransferase involved in cell wall biosynthesis
VVVVDDGSSDNTAKASRKAGASVISYKPNQGVGVATLKGLNFAMKNNYNFIIFMDGDGQHDPKYLPEFIRKLKNNDLVVGWRDLSNYPWNLKLWNFSMRTLTGLICPTGIKDPECGYRAIKLEGAKKLRLEGKRYEKDAEFIYEAWRNKFKVDQVRIKVPVFHRRVGGIKAANLGRAFKNVAYLLKIRFSR